MPNKNIHSRGYLPHWDFAGSLQGITFRLADSVPAAVIEEWLRELEADLAEPDKVSSAVHRKISKYEDAGHGSCLLADREYASIVQEALVAGHESSYTLLDWCVMPNHVHVMLKLLGGASLGKIVQGWKGGTAIQINRLLERKGSFWMRDYHDRLIRDLDHFYDARDYIRNNPVEAGLCELPEEWLFSSAGAGWEAEQAK